MADSMIASVQSGVDELIRTAISFLPKLFIALLIIYAGKRFSDYSERLFSPVVEKILERPAMLELAKRSVRYAIMGMALLVSLSTIGINLTPLWGAVLAGGIIVGFIVGPVLSGYVSGMLLLVDKPYEIGDRIEIADMRISGYVKDIGFRVTRILTADGNLVVLPNSEVIKKNLINYSHEELRTRRELPVTISYESDLNNAIEIMINAAKGVDGVIQTGKISMCHGVEKKLEPQVFIRGFGENGIELLLRVWYEDPHALKRRDSEIYKKVYEGFKKHGIEIPYPRRDVSIMDMSKQA